MLSGTDRPTTPHSIFADAFDSYTTATGGGMDPATGMLSITQEQYKNLQPLTFHIGSETYNFSPNAQIWPRSLNKAISGKDDQIYLVVNDMGDSFPGLDFILGYTFLWVACLSSYPRPNSV